MSLVLTYQPAPEKPFSATLAGLYAATGTLRQMVHFAQPVSSDRGQCRETGRRLSVCIEER